MNCEQAKRHAKEIKAFCDGKEIEYCSKRTGTWGLATAPAWELNTHYRIKGTMSHGELVGKVVRPRTNQYSRFLVVGYDAHTGTFRLSNSLTYSPKHLCDIYCKEDGSEINLSTDA